MPITPDVVFNYFVLSGNASEPINTLSQLKGLQGMSVLGQRLDGPFPGWAVEINDLSGLGLSGNRFSGSIPDLSRLERFSSLSADGCNFTGAIPLLHSLSPLPTIQSMQCDFGCSGNAGLFWKYHPAYYDYSCIKSNPRIPWSRNVDRNAILPPYGPTPWACMPTCEPERGFYRIRRENGQDPESIRCASSDSVKLLFKSCTGYMDDTCEVQSSGSTEAPNNTLSCNDANRISG
jgi:hypothetical protein